MCVSSTWELESPGDPLKNKLARLCKVWLVVAFLQHLCQTPA
jgi:hypothetical protein